MKAFSIFARRWPIAILLVVLVLVAGISRPALAEDQAAPWSTPVNVDNLPGGGSLSLVADSAGGLHVAYYGENDAAEFGLKYAYFNGITWKIEFLTQITPTIAETSIALDKQGHPHITYYIPAGSRLMYTYFSGSTWAAPVVVEDAGVVGETSSLVMDSSDRPRVAYWDATLQDVRYASYTGAAWSLDTVEDLDCAMPFPQRVSLSLDVSGNPHVSYHDCGEQPSLPTKLKYAFKDSTGWHAAVIDTGNNSGLSSNIKVDAQGNPHISYRSGNFAGGLMYAGFDGANWQYSPSIDPDFWYGAYSSLTLDSSRPRIAYTFWPSEDPSNDAAVKEFRFAYISGARRSLEMIDSAPDETVNAAIALAIDPEGNYHVVYWDDVVDRLRYSHRGSIQQLLFLPLSLNRP